MSVEAVANQEIPSRAQYARFARRLRAMLIDWILALIVIFGAVLIAVSVGNDIVSRVLALLVALLLVLYEPLLVSRIGGTLGHQFNNLRVVDDDRGGNNSLRKAFIRAAIKAVLGWYSFLAMAATRRNQAVHDLLTHSTVQIRDAGRARPHHFITERTELAAANMPSPRRRVAIILIYLAGSFVIYILLAGATVSTGLISDACLDNDVCSAGEKILTMALATAYFVAATIVIALGWRGRLPGARRTA